MTTWARHLSALALIALAAGCDREIAPVRSPRQALRTFTLPEGYRIELVAAEPLVRDPVAIDFDPDGRMYVVEMTSYMPSVTGEGEDTPNGRIVVLEDDDDDGRMDRRTVFLDSLVLPRTVSVLEHGVLVGAPPYLWLARDTTGDFVADVRTVVRDDYGAADANPEHNANGALWGIDNWLHTANYTQQLRLRPDGTFEARAIPSLGQWGVAADEYGHLYRNTNEDPLHADLVAAHYATVFETSSLRGVYERLTPNVAVWPAHKTPAINRGYRERTMRPDSTLAHYTSAGSPTPYTGDRYPDDVRGTVFITESAGNLVGQFTLDVTGGTPRSARRTQDSVDFLTSTDERFRPVNLANAPDGTLYVVDMYRGIIQHRSFITDYLETKIRERGLDQPGGSGRIYRIVHRDRERGPRPRLSSAPQDELISALGHPIGWWRITAQRLLVERGDTSVAARIRGLLGHADDRARVHALWTLDGLGVADTATLERALGDASAQVRAAAVRISEPFVARGVQGVRVATAALASDTTASVRRQVMASLYAMGAAERFTVVRAVVERGESDAVTAELAARSVGARAADLLALALRATATDDGAAMASALGAEIARTGSPGDVARATAIAADERTSRRQRVALMTGLTRGSNEARALLLVSARPQSIARLAEATDGDLSAAARQLENRLVWPGKPRRDPNALRPLTEDEAARVALGREEYGKICIACHQADGAGAPGVAGSLVGSAYVNGTPLRLVRILLQGKEGTMLMPPIGATMPDEQIAAILTYIRREWGNAADPIDAAFVKEIRGVTTGRTRAWTDEELARVNR